MVLVYLSQGQGKTGSTKNQQGQLQPEMPDKGRAVES